MTVHDRTRLIGQLHLILQIASRNFAPEARVTRRELDCVGQRWYIAVCSCSLAVKSWAMI